MFFHGPGVHIRCENRFEMTAQHPAEHAGIGPEVNGQLTAVLRRHPLDNAAFFLCARRSIIGIGIILAPFRILFGRTEPRNAALKGIRKIKKLPAPHGRASDLCSGLASVFILFLHTCMEIKMQVKPRRQTGMPGQKPAGEIKGHAVDPLAGKKTAAPVGFCDQGQRRHKMPAKLPVGLPGAFAVMLLEREQINKYRTGTDKLHIICCGVLEDEPLFQRAFLQLQRQQRSLLQLAETPFIGV